MCHTLPQPSSACVCASCVCLMCVPEWVCVMLLQRGKKARYAFDPPPPSPPPPLSPVVGMSHWRGECATTGGHKGFPLAKAGGGVVKVYECFPRCRAHLSALKVACANCVACRGLYSSSVFFLFGDTLSCQKLISCCSGNISLQTWS